MSGFAFQVSATARRRACDIKDALDVRARLRLGASDDQQRACAGLARATTAKLDDYLVDALTATETRPRCEQFGDGALLNLRGRSDDELTSSDPLASVRIWAIDGPRHLGHAQDADRGR